MSFKSDLALDGAKFAPNAVPEKTAAFNHMLANPPKQVPPFWESGAPEARKARAEGRGPFPKPVVLPQGQTGFLPSRDSGRAIPTRIMPCNGKSQGVFMQIHGGGWVLSNEAANDPLLEWIANALNVTVVSIGYRLAPEDPFPAGPNDCYDAGEYLVDNSTRLYDAPLLYIGGDSAGAHLSSLAFFHLLKARPQFNFKALCLSYGVYSVGTELPSLANFDLPLVLTRETVRQFIKAFTPDMSIAERNDPSVSPLYVDLPKLMKETGRAKLPPAFFAIGTLDCLMDENILMASKWMQTGSEAALKIYPGAPHGFTMMPIAQVESAGQWRSDLAQWINSL